MPTVTPRGSRRIMLVKSPLVLPGRLALLAAGHARKKAQVVRDEGEITFCSADRLAGVYRLESGKFVGIGVDGVGELQEHRRALFGRGVEPDLVVGLLCRGHGPVDVLFVGDGDLGDHVACGRVDVLASLALRGVHPLPTDEQRAVLFELVLHNGAPFANRVPGRRQVTSRATALGLGMFQLLNARR